MNILMFLGGSYQKFTKETQRFPELTKRANALIVWLPQAKIAP
jgi:hypothetical protein